MIFKNAFIDSINLVQTNYIHCLHRRFSLAQIPLSNSQAVCTIQCIILLERSIKVHQIMQPDRFIH